MKTKKLNKFSDLNSLCYYFWKYGGTFLYKFVEIVLPL